MDIYAFTARLKYRNKSLKKTSSNRSCKRSSSICPK